MPPSRLLSLDAFRGLTIAAMVLVNNPGTWVAVYAPLKHAEWHGLTPTDVIFPFFLFIVGVAIPLSRPTAGRVLRRAAVIFAPLWFVVTPHDAAGLVTLVGSLPATIAVATTSDGLPVT